MADAELVDGDGGALGEADDGVGGEAFGALACVKFGVLWWLLRGGERGGGGSGGRGIFC